MGKESIQLLSTPGHRPRSVLLFFCSSLSKSSLWSEKKCRNCAVADLISESECKGTHFFPTRQIFHRLFSKKMHFCTNGTENGEARGGADTYLLLRTRVRERTDGSSPRKRRKRRTNILSPGISIFSDVFGIEGFLCPEKGGKGEKDENVVLGCLGCLQKNNGRFIYKRQRRQPGTTCLSRIGELENLYSFYL